MSSSDVYEEPWVISNFWKRSESLFVITISFPLPDLSGDTSTFLTGLSEFWFLIQRFFTFFTKLALSTVNRVLPFFVISSKVNQNKVPLNGKYHLVRSLLSELYQTFANFFGPFPVIVFL